LNCRATRTFLRKVMSLPIGDIVSASNCVRQVPTDCGNPAKRQRAGPTIVIRELASPQTQLPLLPEFLRDPLPTCPSGVADRF
jgi:hypothetical protein